MTADAQTRILKLIRITKALGEIFAQENRLISNRRADEIGPLQAEKQRLSAEYMNSINELAQDRTSVSATDTHHLSHLRTLALALEARAVNQRNLVSPPQPNAADS